MWIPICSVLAAGVFLSGCGGGDDGGTPTGTSTASNTTTTSGGAGGAGGGMMSGGGGAPGGMGMPGMGAMGGGQQQVSAAPAPKNTAPAPGFRSDPLKPWWDTTPRPTPVLAYVDPVRIAIPNSAAEEKPEGVEIQEVPNRRVAGILTGNGVYALIDDFSGKAEVVKPGQVLDDGYHVVSINQSSVVLKKVVDNRTYIQTVPLTDAGSSTTTFAPPGGMGMPGGGRMPGMGGSGGRMRGPGGGGGAASGLINN